MCTGNRTGPAGFQWGVRIAVGRRGWRLGAVGGLAVALSLGLSIELVGRGEALAQVAPLQLPVRPVADRTDPPAVTWQDVRVGRVTRRYLLAVPPTPVGTPPDAQRARPLVVVFHGLWQHPGTFARVTGLLADAVAENVVLAVPDAEHGAFNDGRLGPHGPDDDGFFLALRAQLVHRGLVDPARITVAGFSNGAGMAMEIASRHPHQVAAVVAVCGELLAAPGSPRPHSAVTTVLIHGTADRLQPWNGRRRWNHWLVASTSVPATVDSFVRALGPHGAPAVAAVRGARPLDGLPGVTVTTWHDRAGRSVTFYRIAGFGHAWPVRHRTPPGHLRGRIVDSAPIGATAITLATARAARAR